MDSFSYKKGQPSKTELLSGSTEIDKNKTHTNLKTSKIEKFIKE
jgi:hypothetical protein